MALLDILCDQSLHHVGVGGKPLTSLDMILLT